MGIKYKSLLTRCCFQNTICRYVVWNTAWWWTRPYIRG